MMYQVKIIVNVVVGAFVLCLYIGFLLYEYYLTHKNNENNTTERLQEQD